MKKKTLPSITAEWFSKFNIKYWTESFHRTFIISKNHWVFYIRDIRHVNCGILQLFPVSRLSSDWRTVHQGRVGKDTPTTPLLLSCRPPQTLRTIQQSRFYEGGLLHLNYNTKTFKQYKIIIISKNTHDNDTIFSFV